MKLFVHIWGNQLLSAIQIFIWHFLWYWFAGQFLKNRIFKSISIWNRPYSYSKAQKTDNNKSWLTLIYSYCQKYGNKISISATAKASLKKSYLIPSISFFQWKAQRNDDAIFSAIPVTYNTRKEIFYLGRWVVFN